MAVPELHPDSGRRFLIGDRGGRAIPINGTKDGVVRRPNDAQQRASRGRSRRVVKPAVALPIVSQAQHLGDKGTQLAAIGQLKDHGRLCGTGGDLGDLLQGEELQPAGNRDRRRRASPF